MIRIPPDPDGQDAAANGMPSPSDCYPAGPVGPCVAGGPVGPDDYLLTLDSSEHLVLEYADPVGQHDADLDTAESLEYTVVENILDGRPMEGVTCPELYSLRLLDATLDGGLVERISEWTPVINPAISYTLDSRPMEEITNLEHSALGVSLDSRPTEGAPCQEPLEQSVLSSSLAVRPAEGITEKVWDWKPVINPVISYTLDSQLMEGITYHERLARGVSLDSRPTEGAPCLEPPEQLVLSLSLAARPVDGVAVKVLEGRPVIQPVQDSTPDGQPMEGTTYLEHPALGVSLDSRLREG